MRTIFGLPIREETTGSFFTEKMTLEEFEEQVIKSFESFRANMKHINSEEPRHIEEWAETFLAWSEIEPEPNAEKKIFYFNPNSYSMTAYVLASSLEEAKAKLLETKKGDDEYHDENIEEIMNSLRNENINAMASEKPTPYGNKYTVEQGDLFFGEIS